MNYNEIIQDSTYSAVDRLKRAMMYRKTRELHWLSSDGEYLYTADSPLDPEINAEDYGDMPAFRAEEVLNGWFIRRIHMGKVGIEATLDATMYAVTRSDVSVVEWNIPTSLFDPRIDDPLGSIQASTNYQTGLSEQSDPVLQDLANLDNAIFDLDQDTEEFVRELRMKRATMTPEEKFRERELQRKWDVEPARNETGHKVWWSISVINLLFTVYADTAEEAIQLVEDKYNAGRELTMFFISIEKDDSQEKFEPYKDEKIKRLIPFSNTVWPEDQDSMTDEQKSAFNRLNK